MAEATSAAATYSHLIIMSCRGQIQVNGKKLRFEFWPRKRANLLTPVLEAAPIHGPVESDV